MNYEQKYKDALSRAKALYAKGAPDSLYLEEIFSELRESEDEKIKKAVHIYLDWLDGRKEIAPRGEYSIRDMISWLEKQKVLSAEEELQGKKDVLWCIKQASKYAKDENEMGTCWFAEKWLEKQCEQKPTDEEMKELLRTEYEKGRADALSEMKSSWDEWDEDDIYMLEQTIKCVNNSEKLEVSTEEIEEWLKALGIRMTNKQ